MFSVSSQVSYLNLSFPHKVDSFQNFQKGLCEQLSMPDYVFSSVA